MKYATLLLGLATLASLSSCRPYCCPKATCCGPDSCSLLETCSKCKASGTHTATATHRGNGIMHSAVCPTSADHEIIYRVKPGT